MSLKRPRAAPQPVEALFLENSDSSSDDEPEEVFHSRGASQSGQDDDQPQMYASGGKMGKKRRDKHAPAEVSSKRRPSFLQNVVPVPKIIRRDPRFEATSGTFNETMFQNAYKFVDDAAAAKPAPPRAISEWMAKEREARAKGKKPFFLSKAGKRELAMTDKFKELEAKGPGALDKFMQKRRKKKASKDKRALPWQSRSQPPA